MKQRRPPRNCNFPRRGLAIVEFALALPLLVMLVLGSIEASNAIFLRQAITVVAYETAQIASAYGGTEEEAKQRGMEILENYKIEEATITIYPPVDESLEPGTRIDVTVSAPSDSNSIGPPWFFRNATYQRKFTMFRL